jgi:hypothetical protein
MRRLLILLAACAIGHDFVAAQHANPFPDTIHSDTPRWRSSVPWTAGSNPTLVIGSQEGDESVLFDRIVAVFMTREHVIVGDGGSKSVRVFTHGGTLVRAFGREGEGPGELRDLTRLWLDTDGAPVAYDARLKRLTIYRPSEHLIVPVRGTAAFVTPFGRLRNGLFVTGTPHLSQLGGAHGDILEDFTTVWVGSEQHREIARVPNRGRMVFGTSEWTRYPFLPLTVGPAVAVGSSGFVVGHGTTPELRYFDQEGQPSLLISWSPPRQRVSRAIRSEVGEILVKAQRDQAAWRRFVRDVPYPEYLPLFDQVAIDASGVTWVRNFDHTGRAAEIWTVIDSDGHWLGELSLPRGFQATHFGEAQVAGILRDDLGVERAAILPLKRR